MDPDTPRLAEQEDEEEAGFKPRRARRHIVDEVTQLSPHHLFRVEVQVRNLSPFGFMAECDERVRIGSYVALDVPGIGSVHAQVRWQIGARMGGMFLDPISLARCEWAAVKAGTPFSAA
ncbi:hypothetical protein GCM10023232_09260 [Sphingosinicella ginsenosidimutans]|uniref:PilZ domain-containing protein n=1 Tax=Allosphingosinicella ginsenosidimutans TaxID=1176539 RepID=A0A5C6TWW8_9SPHN|nr:hypothetical protein [Sphingosinicella ginsenosidimutans]TXC64729.1 hypothetical protein FRZ32_14385 [Sphingosinicella ginsenosidimutans]